MKPQLAGQGNEAATMILKSRISTYELQLMTERLTPLLQKEMKHALNISSKALKDESDLSGNVDLIKTLDTLHNDIEDHWRSVFSSPSDRADMDSLMAQYERFVLVSLLDDYTPQSRIMPPMDHFFSHTTAQIQLHRAATTNGNQHHSELYNHYVAFPLKEMTLDVDHVSDRICHTAAARQAGAKDSGGLVARLIKMCDWKALAETLIRDHQLAIDLCSHEPVSTHLAWSSEMLPKILKKNEELRSMYFTSLTSPENYTISKHAADLLARYSSSGPEHAALKQTVQDEPQTSSISSAIKDRFKLLADGLKMKSRSSPDEKTALLSRDPDSKSLAASSVMLDEKQALAA